MIRQDPQLFPYSQPFANVSVYDETQGGAAVTSVHSPGGTVLGVPTNTTGGQINQQMSLLGVGVTAGIALNMVGALYGKLGKIVAGILPATQGDVTTAYQPQVLLPLPNPNLTFTIWDPAVDDLPPQYGSSNFLPPNPPAANQVLQVFGTLLLPSPITVDPGEPPTIGLWVLPSLLGANTIDSGFGFWAWQIAVYNAKYTLTYDDGIT